MYIHRNICMIHWNAQQPGGQGLASEFDAYFKALSVEAKEVLSVANTRETVLIIIYSTHSLSRRSCVLPKAQRCVIVTMTRLTITELISQRKASKLAAKVGSAQ